jgi:hypothetical protein
MPQTKRRWFRRECLAGFSSPSDSGSPSHRSFAGRSRTFRLPRRGQQSSQHPGALSRGHSVRFEPDGWLRIEKSRQSVCISECQRDWPAGFGTQRDWVLLSGVHCAGGTGAVAPLRSVKEENAYDMAVTFYSRLGAAPVASFAKIIRDIRAPRTAASPK